VQISEDSSTDIVLPTGPLRAVLEAWFLAIDSAYAEADCASGARTLELANLAALKRVYTAIFTGDLAIWRAACQPDMRLEILGTPAVPFVGSWTGLDNVIAATLRNFALLEQQSVQIETVLAQGDKLVVVAHETGLYRLTGVPYDTRWIHEFRFRDGRVASCREFFDGAGVLAALQPASILPREGKKSQFV
jgi:ketosteroid isomerase-like protein